jgi:hypothetical protein
MAGTGPGHPSSVMNFVAALVDMGAAGRNTRSRAFRRNLTQLFFPAFRFENIA